MTKHSVIHYNLMTGKLKEIKFDCVEDNKLLYTFSKWEYNYNMISQTEASYLLSSEDFINRLEKETK